MPEPKEFAKSSIGSIESPGEFKFENPQKVGRKNENYYKGRVAILIDSQTAGADGNLSEIFFPGDIRTMISGIGVNYPDGTETQRIVILPDIEVKPTLIGIRNGKDEILERALEYIHTGE